jgi:hypothetical protein
MAGLLSVLSSKLALAACLPAAFGIAESRNNSRRLLHDPNVSGEEKIEHSVRRFPCHKQANWPRL